MLSPEDYNVLVTKDNIVKITDFALSKVITVPHIAYTPEDPKDRERLDIGTFYTSSKRSSFSLKLFGKGRLCSSKISSGITFLISSFLELNLR